MDSGDDDMFAISDEETSLLTETGTVNGNGMSNPVEEHLLKQLTDVQNSIDTRLDEISEVKVTTAHILNALQQRALYGENVSSDFDCDVSVVIYLILTLYLVMFYFTHITCIGSAFE